MNKITGCIAIACLGISCIIAMASDLLVGCLAMTIFGAFALLIGEN